MHKSAQFDTPSFMANHTYDGQLGALYTTDQTTFRVWAPTAKAVSLNLYKTGHGNDLIEQLPMTASDKGTFSLTVNGDQNGRYYTYLIHHEKHQVETYDPYAKAAGVNGDRSMVIDLSMTNPVGWDNDTYVSLENPVDAIVYETHIRDLSIHTSSNIKAKGKYLGVVEPNTQTQNGIPTGLSHLKSLGITHVQILPMFDYNSVDESNPLIPQFNWGYDPKNYNVPEGSYATDPFCGETRIKELKTMIKGLHDEGLGVIMDVVYNHTAHSEDSNFNLIVPNYYYRMKGKHFSDASACGNETASERTMMRKFIVDSVKYWANEYHIDGFRFDLMGIHDVETMRQVEREVKAINPNAILYGEGWTGGDSTLDESKRLMKKNISEVPGIGAFNDDFRDAVKGHVFEPEAPAFVNGAIGFENGVKFGIVGGVPHPQVDAATLPYSDLAWALSPSQTVNYVEAHDNLTLWDKLKMTNPRAHESTLISMVKLSNALVLTSQGIPFMQLGMDFLRTKQGEHNSYNLPDAINQIDWSRKEQYVDVFEYHQGLVQLRKTYSCFRLKTKEEITSRLRFLKMPSQSVGYTLDGDDSHGKMYLFFNAKSRTITCKTPEGNYLLLANETAVCATGLMAFKGGSFKLPPHSAYIFVEA